ncbi:unnamed protein product [marine sediment metagenome]|uniref:Uncharacterized protein n=1 Tax=marine sediment metagenome TaxID=412755 RepID=X1NV30_9ZZZZ
MCPPPWSPITSLIVNSQNEIEIGKEHEKHTFNVPTVVSLPKGLPHFPIVCNKVDKPYGVVQVGLGPKYEARWID